MKKNRGIRTRLRKDFSKIPPLDRCAFFAGDPDQLSYDASCSGTTPPQKREHHGLQAVFNSVFPIPDFKGTTSLEFVEYTIGEPKYGRRGVPGKRA